VDAALAWLERAPERFFLFVHLYDPHAPYGAPEPWASRFGGRAYAGEIAFADAQVARLREAVAKRWRGGTLWWVTSDHGESLGEHGYYFDHGENLFDPSVRIPLIVAGPEVAEGRRTDVLATTLDLVPTILDALKVSYPPDLAGESLLPATRGERRPDRRRLPGQNDRNLLGAWDRRYKIVAAPSDAGVRYTLYDREKDPGETRDAAGDSPDRMREERRELELFRERIDGFLVRTRRLLEGQSGEERLSPEACEKLKAMGYVQQGCS
jgi:arylsulfatase A-like enzyme